jgi:tetratricopeptide (TPR) repeat protein
VAEDPPKPAPPDRPRDLTGSMIGRYRVVDRAGRGGMGEVYRATDTLLRRDVALKRITPRAEDRSDLRRRILGEARRASGINDPRIAAVYDVLEDGGEIFIVMEYVEGRSLREILAERPGLDQFWDVAGDCVRGLGVAHGAGLVHRDIKPGNIMLTSTGQVKILDFGLARQVFDPRVGETDTTDPISLPLAGGTPAYMAPEAHLGKETDHRADIFSLGALFYEFLAGRRPFRGEGYGALAQQILNGEPEPLLSVNPEVPPNLANIITRMLAKDPDDRYQSAGELLRDLEAVRGGESVTIPVPRRRTATRRPIPIAVPLVASAAAFAALYLFAFGGWERITARLTPLPRDKNVAVLSFASRGRGQEEADIALGMTSVLRDGLSRLTGGHPLQVASVADGIKNDVKNPVEAREFLGANLALQTDIDFDDRGLGGEVQLVETSGGRTLRRASLAGAPDARTFLRRALQKSAEMLELTTESVPAERLLGLGTEGAGTLDFYLRGLGRLSEAGDTTEIGAALRWFRLADRTDPESPMNLTAMARADQRMYEKTKDKSWLAVGEAAARRAVVCDSARADAHKALGFILWDKGRLEEATEEMNTAFDLDPTDGEAMMYLGRFHGRRGLVDEEERIYRTAADRRPRDWRPYFLLATKVYYEHGRFSQAKEAFTEMIRRAPDYHVGYESLGGLYVLEGNYDKAVENLEKAIALHPSAEALTNLGAAYFNLREFDAAIDAFNEVFRLEYVDYLLWLNLGDAYYWAPGKRALAGRAYREALELGRKAFRARPYDFRVPANLAPVFLRFGEPDSARSYLDIAIANDPDNPMIQYSAALTKWGLGERGEAMDWLERAVAGGYPVQWLRDSPVFDDWRNEDRFRRLVGATEGQGAGERDRVRK